MANKYLTKLNNVYGKVNLQALATKTFQDIVDSKNAVLSILSHTGIAGFKFHIPEREQVRMQSRITTHYLENNEPAQDHIANEPIEITLQGYQGEYFYPINKFESMAAAVIPTMALVPEFMTQLSPITKQVKQAKLDYEQSLNPNQFQTYNGSAIANSINNYVSGNNIGDGSIISQTITDYVNRDRLSSLTTAWKNNFNAVDLFAIFQNLYKFKSAQARAFYFFEALWKARMTFSVETSWKRYDNMAILSVVPVRDKTLDITDFKVTLQQINRTYSLSTSVNAAGRTRTQLAEEANKGTDKGLQVDVSTNTN